MNKALRIFGYLIWIIPFFLFLECSVRPVAEPDLFFYFALVEKYLSTGHWPITDPFVYTLPGDSLMTLHQWLGYWVYYLPYQLLGWSGPIILKSTAVLVFFCIPLIPFWLRRKPLPDYFVLVWTLAVFVAHHRFRERVSLFGDLFILLLSAGLVWCSHKRWFWYSLPVLFWAWAQMHPSFPLGWVILAMFFILRPRREWQIYEVAAAALCLVMPVLNPMGLDGTLYPFRFSRDIEPYLRQYVVEWLPLTDSRLFEFRFLYIPFFTMLPLTVWRLWSQRREARLFEWFLLALASALTLKSVRFGLMAQGIFLTLIVNNELRQPLFQKSWRWALIPLATICAAITVYKINLSNRLNLTIAERFYIDTNYFPEASVDALNLMKPQLHIFNSFGYGGYLAWRWQGNPGIFFHGFSTNFKFYEDFYNHPQEGQKELDEVIAKYDIGIFLLSKLGNDDNFIHILDRHQGWQKIREDRAAVIFAKRDARVFP
ncbi:MAG: hypothetical protein ACXVA9_01785 [Bdellovibrionales bacterium]